MRQLNGNPVVQFSMLATFEFTQAEADMVISLSEAEAAEQLLVLLNSRSPCETRVHDFQVKEFRKVYGQTLVELRSRELKMLAAPSSTSPTE